MGVTNTPAGTAPRVLSGTEKHIVVPTRLVSEAEIIVSVMEKRLSFAGMSVSAMEMNASMKETMASVSTKVRSAVQKVRSAVEMIFSVFQRIISVSNKIISVTEIIVDGGEAAMLLIRRDLPANGDNYFPYGKDPRRVANDLVRNGKESVRDGRDRGRHSDDHLWDGENRLADGLHPRCDGNHFHEVIGDCMRNGNHYRRDFNKPVRIGNDRGDFPFDRWFASCRCVHDALTGTPCSIPNGMGVCLFFNGLK